MSVLYIILYRIVSYRIILYYIIIQGLSLNLLYWLAWLARSFQSLPVSTAPGPGATMPGFFEDLER